MRRMDASAGQSFSADGKPLSELGDWEEELLAFKFQEKLLAAQDAADGLTDEDSIPQLTETPICEAKNIIGP